jgi:hypothetical protein
MKKNRTETFKIWSKSWDDLKKSTTYNLRVISITVSQFWQKIKTGMLRAWNSLKSGTVKAFHSVLLAIKNTFTSSLTWLSGLGRRFYTAGSNLMKQIADGIRAAASGVENAVRDMAARIKALLPFSPAKTGPLATLHKVNIVGEIAKSVNAYPLLKSINEVAEKARFALNSQLPVLNSSAYHFAPRTPAAFNFPARAAGGLGNITINVNISAANQEKGFYKEKKELAMEVAKQTGMEIERIMRRKYAL